MEALSEWEYTKLFDILKTSFVVVRPHHYIGTSKYLALNRAQRYLSGRGVHSNKKLYRIVKDAKRALGNPSYTNLYGVKIVNQMIEMIDNISGNRPAVLEESLLELKESISNMTRLNNEAQEVTKKCDVVAGNLDKIREFIEGSREDMPVQTVPTTSF